VIRIRCPLCHERLLHDDHSMVCASNHRFDRAREGYLNLLPVQQKNSLDPGDDADMVAARRSFLEAGYYAPFRDTLKGIIEPLHAGVTLDSGCGEGWYTQILREVSSDIVALDISKHAVKRAAKRMTEATWMVASSNDIPLYDGSVDVMTAIFSPVQVTEAARVLDDYGSLVIAAPGEKHLWELRDALYPEVRAHEPEKWLDTLDSAFTLQLESALHFSFTLPDNPSVRNLLQMTPHYWRASRERRVAVEALPSLTLQADFRILVFNKKHPPVSVD
jgi:23S rRNA (guanine745-N1)-methyltransferase